MGHTVVKILADYNGLPRDKEEQVWHLVVEACGDSSTLCQGEFFGIGAGTEEFKTKEVKRGGITCKDCLDTIKLIKSIKL